MFVQVHEQGIACPFSDAKQTPVASIRRRDERSNSVRTLTLTVKRNWFLANGSAKTSVS